MKFAVVVLACVAVAHAQFPGSYGRKPAAYSPQPSIAIAKSSAGDQAAEVVKQVSDIQPDGSYNYVYETNNGIAAQAQGTPKDFGGNPPVVPVVSQGSYSFISPEGQQISITYVADENGYQPQGDSIPTPPPVPEAILRSLDYIAKNYKQ